MTEDDILWRKIQKKDEDALKQLFFGYHQKLVSRAYHLVNDHQVAEELVQDLFFTLWEKAKKIRLEGKLENYLMVSIRNKCLNYLKSQFAKQQFVDFEERFSGSVNQPTSYDLEQLSKQVEQAINQLPKKCREIFLLSRRHELSYSEIAEKLGVSKKTVEAQMGIALKKLRQLLNIKN